MFLTNYFYVIIKMVIYVLKVIEFVHELIKNKVNSNDLCVDMTIGNGFDTLLLCNISKFVYGFDIQQIAINNTDKLLKENSKSNYKLICDSHEFVDKYINSKIKCAIYNLGYLPSGNKSITTLATSTINSLKKVIDLLDEKGIIALVVYSGHENGSVEAIELEKFVKTLNQKQFNVLKYDFINQINNPPYAIIIERR